MAKLTYRPVDDRPAPKGAALVLRIMTLVVMCVSLAGVIWIMLDLSEDEPRQWEPEADSVRTNFTRQLTTEERSAEFQKRRADWMARHGTADIPMGPTPTPGEGDNGDQPPTTPPTPFDDDDDRADIRETVESFLGGTRQGVEAERNRERELQLAANLDREPVFDVMRETAQFIEWQPFQDADIERSMNEWAAFGGRQAPIYERLGMQVLTRLVNDPDSLKGTVHSGAYFWGGSQDAVEAYRGRAFTVEGRLFDLYEVTPDEAIVLPDGTGIERYYEGVIALLDRGVARNEHALEQRVVLFQTLKLPAELEAYLGARDGVSHTDKLVTEAISVKLTGAFLRRWVYNREVLPFSTPARAVRSQAHLPLLLVPTPEKSTAKPWELTNELLHQVRDSLRESPAFLETEGAYFAMLAKANEPDDAIETMAEVGYFDLVGAEGGPRYRGQGIAIEGMIGDDYVPVILQPNISGLRRVYRTLVLNDLYDLESERLYLVDMIEAPTGLEPRALVRFEARYYRNVFEAESTATRIRPLLIVKQVRPYQRDTSKSDLIVAAIGVGGLLMLMAVLSYFVISDRRERKAFEQSSLELSRKRLEKRGGLKLKPLPSQTKPEPDPKPDPEPDPESDAKPSDP